MFEIQIETCKIHFNNCECVLLSTNCDSVLNLVVMGLTWAKFDGRTYRALFFYVQNCNVM